MYEGYFRIPCDKLYGKIRKKYDKYCKQISIWKFSEVLILNMQIYYKDCIFSKVGFICCLKAFQPIRNLKKW